MIRDRNSQRLNALGYANLASGVLSFGLNAHAMPWAIRAVWMDLDHMQTSGKDPIGSMMLGVMIAGAVTVVVWYWLYTVVALTNGYLILRRRRYRTCLFLSAIGIPETPLGLIVGVLSVVTLSRDWARALFPSGEALATVNRLEQRDAPGAGDDG